MTDFSSSHCLFQSEEMESEMSIKNLEAQNAQVQVAILELAKGQEELKALMIKKKKKPKGSVGVSHLRRKIKIPVKKFTKPPIPETVGDDEQEDNQSNQGSAKPSLSSNEENDHSGDEPDDEKYQQLEDRMKAMEIQKIPGLDLNDLGPLPGFFSPPKLKIPIFEKNEGVFSPKLTLKTFGG